MSDKKLFDTTNIVFMILFGIIIAVFMYMRIKEIYFSPVEKWPPEVDECPNMWLKVGPKKCKNILRIGNPQCRGTKGNEKVINFARSEFNDPRAKCQFAKYTCNVDWDGYDKLC